MDIVGVCEVAVSVVAAVAVYVGSRYYGKYLRNQSNRILASVSTKPRPINDHQSSVAVQSQLAMLDHLKGYANNHLSLHPDQAVAAINNEIDLLKRILLDRGRFGTDASVSSLLGQHMIETRSYRR